MDINLAEDIISVTELKQKTNSIMKQVNSSGRPIVLTVNGRAEAVLIGTKEYQKIQESIEVMKEILLGEQNVITGKFIDASAFFKRLRNEKRV